MKNYFLLYCLLIAVGGFSQSNFTGVVKYESNYSQRNIDNYFSKKRNLIKDKKQVKYYDDLLLNVEKVNSTLSFSISEAIYSVDKKLTLETHGNLAEKLILVSTGGSRNYYTSSTTKTLEIQDCQTLDKCFIIVSPLKTWQISQETKKIAGYICYKATSSAPTNNNTENHITAWFTPQIPVGFGPKDFNGLPGLILELETDFMTYKAAKLIINPTEKVLVEKPSKGEKVTLKEFNKMVKEATANFMKIKQ